MLSSEWFDLRTAQLSQFDLFRSRLRFPDSLLSICQDKHLYWIASRVLVMFDLRPRSFGFFLPT